jgi:hypothetical protein
MDAQQIISLLGSYAGDPRLEAFLTTLNVTARPKLPKGEFTAYLEMKQEGVSLIFRDEAYLKREKKPLGRSPLVLVGAHFYSEGHDGYAEFKGDLPHGLTLSDSRNDIIRKMGESTQKRERDGVVRNEQWSLPDYRVGVTYSKDGSSILTIYCGIV